MLKKNEMFYEKYMLILNFMPTTRFKKVGLGTGLSPSCITSSFNSTSSLWKLFLLFLLDIDFHLLNSLGHALLYFFFAT